MDQLHTGRVGHRLHVSNGLPHDIGELNRFKGQRFPSALDSLEVENVIDQPNQSVAVGHRDAKQVCRLFIHLSQHS